MYLKENMVNIVKRAKRMTDFLGHFNIFATLSQVLTYNRFYAASSYAGALRYGFLCNHARKAALFLYVLNPNIIIINIITQLWQLS